MSGKLSEANIKILSMKSGGCCAFPGCGETLYIKDTANDPAKVLGEIAHIHGEKPGSARYDATISSELVNSIGNLILLCPNHHTTIDKQPGSYSVDMLNEFKKEHEARVERAILNNVQKVTFTELKEVTAGILSAIATSPSVDYSVLDPATKMKKNGLTDAVKPKLIMGLAKSNEVKRFIGIWDPADWDFGNRLKKGFEDEYRRLFKEGVRGDSLFNELHTFSCGGYSEILRQSAGLAVLGYFFEACEVFDK